LKKFLNVDDVVFGLCETDTHYLYMFCQGYEITLVISLKTFPFHLHALEMETTVLEDCATFYYYTGNILEILINNLADHLSIINKNHRIHLHYRWQFLIIT